MTDVLWRGIGRIAALVVAGVLLLSIAACSSHQLVGTGLSVSIEQETPTEAADEEETETAEAADEEETETAEAADEEETETAEAADEEETETAEAADETPTEADVAETETAETGTPEADAAETETAETGTPEADAAETETAETGTPEADADETETAETGTPEADADEDEAATAETADADEDASPTADETETAETAETAEADETGTPDANETGTTDADETGTPEADADEDTTPSPTRTPRPTRTPTATATPTPTPLPDPEVSHGPLSGEVSDTSVILWARGNRAGTLTFEVAEADQFKGVITNGTVEVDESTDYTGEVLVTGLNPGQQYFYRVSLSADNETSDASEAQFTTAPAPVTPGDLSFVFSSCVGGLDPCRDPAEGWPIFATMADEEPDFFILTGDSIYADVACDTDATTPGKEDPATDLEGFRTRYRYHLEDEAYASFLAQTPVYVTWDDHEILDNFGGPELQRYNLQRFDDGIQAYFEYWPITTAPITPTTAVTPTTVVTPTATLTGTTALTATTGTTATTTLTPTVSVEPLIGTEGAEHRIYRTVSYGQHADFFILDTRSYRDPNANWDPNPNTGEPKTMLGEEQFAWLQQSLQQSQSTWKFVVTSVPLSYPTGFPQPEIDGRDGWANFMEPSGYETELMALLFFIERNNIDNVVFLTGDTHWPFALSYDPDRDGEANFYEFGASPMSALPLAPATIRDQFDAPQMAIDPTFNPTIRYAEGNFFNFGHMAIDEDGALTFRVVDEEGTERYSMTVQPEE